jgi:hypothetical protein
VRVTNSVGRVNSKTVTVSVLKAAAAKSTHLQPAASVVASDPYQIWIASKLNAIQLGNPEFSGLNADPDGDGISNENEYLFGLLPLTSETAPTPGIVTNGNLIELTFVAKEAAGPGYDGLSRHYALETANALDASNWSIVAGCSDIIGSGQAVSLTTTATGQPQFYRLSIWLAP